MTHPKQEYSKNSASLFQSSMRWLLGRFNVCVSRMLDSINGQSLSDENRLLRCSLNTRIGNANQVCKCLGAGRSELVPVPAVTAAALLLRPSIFVHLACGTQDSARKSILNQYRSWYIYRVILLLYLINQVNRETVSCLRTLSLPCKKNLHQHCRIGYRS